MGDVKWSVWINVGVEGFFVVINYFDDVVSLVVVEVDVFIESVFNIEYMFDGWVVGVFYFVNVCRCDVYFFGVEYCVEGLFCNVELFIVVLMNNWIKWFFGNDFWQNYVVVWVGQFQMLSVQIGSVCGVDVVMVCVIGSYNFIGFFEGDDFVWYVVCMEIVSNV